MKKNNKVRDLLILIIGVPNLVSTSTLSHTAYNRTQQRTALFLPAIRRSSSAARFRSVLRVDMEDIKTRVGLVPVFLVKTEHGTELALNDLYGHDNHNKVRKKEQEVTTATLEHVIGIPVYERADRIQHNQGYARTQERIHHQPFQIGLVCQSGEEPYDKFIPEIYGNIVATRPIQPQYLPKTSNLLLLF